MSGYVRFLAGLCCFLDTSFLMLEELILTEERTLIVELVDRFGSDGRKLMIQIGFVEVNKANFVLEQVLCDPCQFGFVLGCQQDDMRMIWQIAEIKHLGSFNGRMRALHGLLSGCKVLPYKDVNVVLVGLVAVLQHGFLLLLRIVILAGHLPAVRYSSILRANYQQKKWWESGVPRPPPF